MQQLQDTLHHSAAGAHWKRIGVKHHHGIVAPLFALHGQKSCGIGEFPDLLLLLGWCKCAGLDVIQLLPLNDTGLSPSPYGALSAYALNPLHLGLAALPFVAKDAALQAMLVDLLALNATTRVPYAQLHVLRERFLRAYFLAYASEFLCSDAFLDFQHAHPWLEEYALFKALKIAYQWQSWSLWPEDLQNPTLQKLDDLKRQYAADMAYHTLVQFFCFQQLASVKQQASQQGIMLMGDLPIFLDRESADIWLHRDLFDMQQVAGAPPDGYSDEGQNWGFPLYNWPEMEKQGYQWWTKRICVAAQFYHIYRVDHVVGLFRIWAIPPGKGAKMGHFIPENADLWIQHGQKILQKFLQASPILPIAEDLGSVPLAVKMCLQQLGICGTKVMRWERDWEKVDHPPIPFAAYPALGLTTVSTHDSEPLHMWWENAEARTFADAQGWPYAVPLDAIERTAILYASHHTSSLFHINPLQEYLAHFPTLSWPDPAQERINIPGSVSDQNWSYRFRPSVEDITNHPHLASYMANMLI